MNHLNMHATFLRWPLGMTSFPAWADLYGAMFREWHGSTLPFDDWLFERLRPLLEAPGRVEYFHGNKWCRYDNYIRCSVGYILRSAWRSWFCDEIEAGKQRHFPRRVVLLDGTVVREWPIDEYDGIF